MGMNSSSNTSGKVNNVLIWRISAVRGIHQVGRRLRKISFGPQDEQHQNATNGSVETKCWPKMPSAAADADEYHCDDRTPEQSRPGY
jgi:hypothetical protein